VFHVIFHLIFFRVTMYLTWSLVEVGELRLLGRRDRHPSMEVQHWHHVLCVFFRWKSILCLCLSYFKLIFSYTFGVQPIFSHMCCSFFPSSTAIFASTFPFFIGVFLPSKSAKGGRDRL
jgi:hypothetical protein